MRREPLAARSESTVNGFRIIYPDRKDAVRINAVVRPDDQAGMRDHCLDEEQAARFEQSTNHRQCAAPVVVKHEAVQAMAVDD